jgi:hypothetical protein
MTTRSALSTSGDTLFYQVAAKVSVDQAAVGSPDRFTQYRVGYFFAPRKPGETLCLEDLHGRT